MRENEEHETAARRPVLEGTSLSRFRETHPTQVMRAHGLAFDVWTGGTRAADGGPPLLLLGGGGSFGDSAYHRILDLERSRFVISPSYPTRMQPGRFLHDTGGARSVSELLAALFAVLDELDAPVVDICGDSLGAGIAHVAVRLRPDRVRRVVLSSFGLYTPRHRIAVRAFVSALHALPYEAMHAYYARAFHSAVAAAPEGERIEWRELIEDVLARQTKKTALAVLDLLVDLFANADAYALHQPLYRPAAALLLFGDDDRGFTPREQKALAATYPQGIVQRFAGGGHMLQIAHARETDALIQRFLAEPEAAHH